MLVLYTYNTFAISRKWTASLKRTKPIVPMYPLTGDSTVHVHNCTGKQGLKYCTVALTISLRSGTSENSVFNGFFDILDRNPTSFYRTPLIQAQAHSRTDQESDHITHVRNGLNYLCNDEEQVVPQRSETGKTYGENTTPYFKASFLVVAC